MAVAARAVAAPSAAMQDVRGAAGATSSVVPGLTCFLSPPLAVSLRRGGDAAGRARHGRPRHDGLQRLAPDGAAHRRAREVPSMGLFPISSLPAAFATLATVGETVTAGAALPPMHVLRMRVFIVISALAVLWMLGAIMFRVLRALWGLVASKLPSEHGGSAAGMHTALIAYAARQKLVKGSRTVNDSMPARCETATRQE